MADSNITIQLVDDHAVVRGGFRRLLEENPDISVIAESDSAERAWQDYMKFKPDVVIMDLSMPGMGGMEGINRILSRDKAARILVLTIYDDVFAARVIQAGAKGYINKRSAPRALIKAVRSVMQGEIYIDTTQSDQLTTDPAPKETDPFHSLTRREFEVLMHLLNEKPIHDIANIMCLSPKTVHVHKGHIMRKLGVFGMVGLTRLAIRHQLLRDT